jgi:hypothetical protein
MTNVSAQPLAHPGRIEERLDRLSSQTRELERVMLPTEGHLSSFFISQNRQSAELERIGKRSMDIDSKLAQRPRDPPAP